MELVKEQEDVLEDDSKSELVKEQEDELVMDLMEQWQLGHDVKLV